MSRDNALDRFRIAQRDPQLGQPAAIAELQAGKKTGHWIWYIFPQLAGLGRSATAQFYGLRDLAEACDYLDDPELRQNLLAAAEVISKQLNHGLALRELLGGNTDALKVGSSLTLFEQASLAGKSASPDDKLEPVARIAAALLNKAHPHGFCRCVQTLERTQMRGFKSSQ